MSDNSRDTLKSAERRNFLKLSGMGAFTAAMVAGAAGSAAGLSTAAGRAGGRHRPSFIQSTTVMPRAWACLTTKSSEVPRCALASATRPMCVPRFPSNGPALQAHSLSGSPSVKLLRQG